PWGGGRSRALGRRRRAGRADGAAVEQQLLREGGLARVRVRDDREGAAARDLVRELGGVWLEGGVRHAALSVLPPGACRRRRHILPPVSPPADPASPVAPADATAAGFLAALHPGSTTLSPARDLVVGYDLEGRDRESVV